MVKRWILGVVCVLGVSVCEMLKKGGRKNLGNPCADSLLLCKTGQNPASFRPDIRPDYRPDTGQ